MPSVVDDSPWSLETLRIYLEAQVASLSVLTQQRFEDRDKAVQAALLSADRAVAAALTAAKEAVGKAEVAQEKRLDSVNEFRAQLSDQTATFIPRTEAEQRINAVLEKVTELTARFEKTEGQATGSSTTRTAVITGVGLLFTAIFVVIALVTLRG